MSLSEFFFSFAHANYTQFSQLQYEWCIFGLNLKKANEQKLKSIKWINNENNLVYFFAKFFMVEILDFQTKKNATISITFLKMSNYLCNKKIYTLQIVFFID